MAKKEMISRKEILGMLAVENGSKAYFELLHRAHEMSRAEFGKSAYVFAQIGMNTEPCSANCKFCSMGKDHFAVCCKSIKTREDIVLEVKTLADEGVDAIFLMTTEDYDKNDFLEVGRTVRKQIGGKMDMVANVGDFDRAYALKLKEVGFTGAYHICRLGEGIDTGIPVQTRIDTMDAIRDTGLRLYYCVEPIGPEHTYEQIADEIERAMEYDVDIMAAMRRVPVPGTPKEKDGAIDILEFTKIVAATRIAVQPKISMNAHETNYMTLLAGVNQLYAEIGGNPRDTKAKTEGGNGLSARRCREILQDAGYEF